MSRNSLQSSVAPRGAADFAQSHCFSLNHLMHCYSKNITDSRFYKTADSCAALCRREKDSSLNVACHQWAFGWDTVCKLKHWESNIIWWIVTYGDLKFLCLLIDSTSWRIFHCSTYMVNAYCTYKVHLGNLGVFFFSFHLSTLSVSLIFSTSLSFALFAFLAGWSLVYSK